MTAPRVLGWIAYLALTAGMSGVRAPGPDVVVGGAGPGGLATALEAATAGARVTVVDVASVFGGHAVVSEGGLSFARSAPALDGDRRLDGAPSTGSWASRRWRAFTCHAETVPPGGPQNRPRRANRQLHALPSSTNPLRRRP